MEKRNKFALAAVSVLGTYSLMYAFDISVVVSRSEISARDGIRILSEKEYDEMFPEAVGRKKHREEIRNSVKSLEGFIGQVNPVQEFESGFFGPDVYNLSHSYLVFDTGDDSMNLVYPFYDKVPAEGRRARIDFLPMNAREINSEIFFREFLGRTLDKVDLTNADGVILERGIRYLER